MAALPPDAIEYNQCEEAVRRLTEYLAKELQPNEEAMVQRHLSQCKGCLAKFSFEETLLRTIRERAEQIRAPQELRARILALLQEPGSDAAHAGQRRSTLVL